MTRSHSFHIRTVSSPYKLSAWKFTHELQLNDRWTLLIWSQTVTGQGYTVLQSKVTVSHRTTCFLYHRSVWKLRNWNDKWFLLNFGSKCERSKSQFQLKRLRASSFLFFIIFSLISLLKSCPHSSNYIGITTKNAAGINHTY